MAIVNVDKFFDDALAVADKIAGTTPLTGFDWFTLDMTRSMVPVADGIELAAMVRESGQSQASRELWSIGPLPAEKLAAAKAAERQAELDRLSAAYAANPAYEMEVDPCTFAIGLAKAYRHHTGETPTFLLDDDGEL